MKKLLITCAALAMMAVAANADPRVDAIISGATEACAHIGTLTSIDLDGMFIGAAELNKAARDNFTNDLKRVDIEFSISDGTGDTNKRLHVSVNYFTAKSFDISCQYGRVFRSGY